MDANAIDMLEEIQLRRWARMNYLPAQKRAKLHPVTQAEMEAMDLESTQSNAAALAAEKQNRATLPQVYDPVSRFVPLADDGFLRLDAEHPQLPGPKFLAKSRKQLPSRFADDEVSYL